MFSATQRDKIRSAIEDRAERAGVSRADARRLRRVSGESRLFDRFLDRKAAQLQRENPGAGDGEILKMLLEWITNGGLEQILKFITGIISLFT